MTAKTATTGMGDDMTATGAADGLTAMKGGRTISIVIVTGTTATTAVIITAEAEAEARTEGAIQEIEREVL